MKPDYSRLTLDAIRKWAESSAKKPKRTFRRKENRTVPTPRTIDANTTEPK